jgi:hypothetical protein
MNPTDRNLLPKLFPDLGEELIWAGSNSGWLYVRPFAFRRYGGMNTVILTLIFAFFGSLGFALLFNVEKKHLLLASPGGILT